MDGRSRYAAEKARTEYNSCTRPIPAAYDGKEYTMKPTEVKRFEPLYQRLLNDDCFYQVRLFLLFNS